MGVDNLWKLVEPCGTKIHIETLESRKLAVDASMWLVAFIKAMRLQDGTMMPNAHLIGLFRRVCKLLFFRIKPIFVFDGPAPRLKRLTIQQRRERRAKQTEDLELTAQKLLLNQLKLQGIQSLNRVGKRKRKPSKEKPRKKKKLNSASSSKKRKRKSSEDNVKRAKPAPREKLSPKVRKTPSPPRDGEELGGGFFAEEESEDVGEGGFFAPESSEPVLDQDNRAEDTGEDLDALEVKSEPEEGGFFAADQYGKVYELEDESVFMKRLVQYFKNNESFTKNDEGGFINVKKEKEDKNRGSPHVLKNKEFMGENLMAVTFDSESSGDERADFVFNEKNYEIPKNVDDLAPEEIAKYPMSVQWGIVEKQREKLRYKNRFKFNRAKDAPEDYANLQMQNYIQASTLNQKLEKIRDDMLKDEDGNEIKRLAGKENLRYKFDHPKEWNQKSIERWVVPDERKTRKRRGNKQRFTYKPKALNTASRLSARSKKEQEESWICEHCKYINMKFRKHCGKCKKISADHVERWICALCQLENPGTAEACTLCKTPKDEESKPAKPAKESPKKEEPSKTALSHISKNDTLDLDKLLSLDLDAIEGGMSIFDEVPVQKEGDDNSLTDDEQDNELSTQLLSMGNNRRNFRLLSIANRRKRGDAQNMEEPTGTVTMEDLFGSDVEQQSDEEYVPPKKKIPASLPDIVESESDSIADIELLHNPIVPSKKIPLQEFLELSSSEDSSSDAPIANLREKKKKLAVVDTDDEKMAEENENDIHEKDPPSEVSTRANESASALTAKSRAENQSIFRSSSERPSKTLPTTDPLASKSTTADDPDNNAEDQTLPNNKLELLHGYWEVDEEFTVEISREGIIWGPEMVTSMGILENGKFSTTTADGDVLCATFGEGEIRWDDGDVWRRTEKPVTDSSEAEISESDEDVSAELQSDSPQHAESERNELDQQADNSMIHALDGFWEVTDDFKVRISGGKILWTDDDSSPITTIGSNEVSITNSKNEILTGVIEPGKITWSDGNIWYEASGVEDNEILTDPTNFLSQEIQPTSAKISSKPFKRPKSIPKPTILSPPKKKPVFRSKRQRKAKPPSFGPSFRAKSGGPSNSSWKRMDDPEEEPVPSNVPESFHDEEYDRMHHMTEQILKENQLLRENKRRQLRDSEHITADMTQEAKDLLDMFGVPYIVAPGEAEAQCAELERLGLVDGIISNDCDCFLFGGKVIYKNMFSEGKYVERYETENIEKQFGLDRLKMICLALFLGSDYTDGVKGIGPVNAIETVNAFCPDGSLTGLELFREWLYSPFPPKEPVKSVPNDPTSISTQELRDLKMSWFKWRHRNYKRSWFVSREFPNRQVYKAYVKPNTVIPEHRINWKIVMNKSALADVCYQKFGWDKEKIRETLEPIQERLMEAAQSRIDQYFLWSKKNDMIKSQRAKDALVQLRDETAKIVLPKKQKVEEERKKEIEDAKSKSLDQHGFFGSDWFQK